MFGYVRTPDDLNRDNNDGTFEGVPLTSSFCAFDPNMPTWSGSDFANAEGEVFKSSVEIDVKIEKNK